MDVKIIDLKSTDPYKNVSAEYAYYSKLNPDDLIFLLWQNDTCVVMGRNQNIYRELDLSYIGEHSIKPVRRFTGGGCVYHDLGNLNFTLISSQKNKDLSRWMEIILSALEHEGIHASLEGRNDLLCQGKKFSGMAWLEDEDKYMIHGTLMVDLDLSVLSKCLTPDISKFIGKGIKSVKSRVCNLKDLNPSISVESLKKSLISSMENAFPHAKVLDHVENPFEEKVFEQITSKEWIYGKDEKAQIQRTFYKDAKPLNIDIWIENDIIKDIEIYSDSLDLSKIERLKQTIKGKNYLEINIDLIIDSIW